jgi:cysteine desulfurase/selenocysteine lyase
MESFESQSYSNVHRGNHWLSEAASAEFEQARDTVRDFLNARHSDEIVFTSGTTASINLVAHAWGNENLAAGDEILLTIAEHHSNIVPWQQLAARTGARIVWYQDDIEAGIDVDRWKKLFSPRTRIAAWPAVSNMLGFHAPTTEMTAAASSQNIVTLVDAAQHVPHEPLDVQAWKADFVAFSGHKMLGPTGIGVLYGRQELLKSMPPFLGGGSMIDSVTTDGFEPGALPARFEAGTPPIVQAIGLAAAVRYLQATGLDRISAHEKTLVKSAMNQMAAIPDLRIYGPPAEERAGIVSFTVGKLNSQDLGKMLDLRGVATRAGHHCTMPLHQHLGIRNSLRASFYLYNTLEEIDQFIVHLQTAIKRLS